MISGSTRESAQASLPAAVGAPTGEFGEHAARLGELTLRSEPVHEEAFVHLGAAPQLSVAQWQTASETLRSWAAGEQRQPSELGVRVTLLVQLPLTADSLPDCDFAVPLR
ncbi:MAG: hypothetical protein ACLQUT_00750 [Thermoleophilia bacterium]